MMKKLLSVAAVLMWVSSFANTHDGKPHRKYFVPATYYCAPTTASPAGDDSNSGSISSPWFTLYRAWQTLVAGDTLYLRGGTYNYLIQQNGYMVGLNGTSGNGMIKVWRYPGDAKPVLTRNYDTYVNNVQHWRGGCYLDGDYIWFKGITFYQFNKNDAVFTWSGLFLNDANHNIIEQCEFINNGLGMKIEGDSRGNLVRNTDAYGSYDTLTGGGNADGLGCNYIVNIDSANPNIFRGCRSWWNSDDNYDGWTGGSENAGGVTIYDSCWSWSAGYFRQTQTATGNGEGFKAGGGGSSNPNATQRKYWRCISMYNKHDGFNQNNGNFRIQTYNCLAWKNAVTGINWSENNNIHTWANNWSFDNASCQVYITAESIVDSCSFGLGTSVNGICGPGSGLFWRENVTAADFESLDTTGISGARQSDGTLPNITLLHLVEGSDLEYSGLDVGLAYTGAQPSRGPFDPGGGGNVNPICTSGGDKEITLPTTSTTISFSATDPDGTITGYAIVKFSGPSGGTVVSPTSNSSSITGLGEGTYVYSCTATDNAGGTCTTFITVVVNPEPAPPASGGMFYIRGRIVKVI